MLTDVNEQVEVIAVFKHNQIFPSLVKWNSRIYKIKKLNMRHQSYDGQNLVHYFSVSDDVNFFKLAFDTKKLNWVLEQVYSEG